MANRRFLLINPHIVDVAAYDLWNKPIGLLYIASILKKNRIDIVFFDLLDRFDPYFKNVKNKWGNTGKYKTENIEKKLFSNIRFYYKLKRYGLPEPEFERRLKNLKDIDLVLITSHLTYWYKGVLDIARNIKRTLKNVPIILGGNGAILDSSIYEQSALFDAISKKSDLAEFYDYVENEFNITLNYKPINRKDYPYPLWEVYKNRVTAAIQSSWGCPYHCTYCASNKIYPFFYQREIDDVIGELNHLVSLDFKDVAFYDDAILIKASKHIIQKLKKWRTNKNNKKINFHLPNAIHPEFLTQEISDLMYETSFKTIAVGHDTKSVREKQKKSYPIERTVKILQKSGFKSKNIWIYLLVGLPYQSKEEIYEEMKKINELGATIKLAWFSPIPGTPDFEKIPQKYDDPFYYNNSLYSVISNIISGDEMEKIKQYERELNRRLYD